MSVDLISVVGPDLVYLITGFQLLKNHQKWHRSCQHIIVPDEYHNYHEHVHHHTIITVAMQNTCNIPAICSLNAFCINNIHGWGGLGKRKYVWSAMIGSSPACRLVTVAP